MWYWDYTPASHHAKKPLTKKQLQKIQDGYEQWAMIAEHVKSLEVAEWAQAKEKIQHDLDTVFL